MTDEPRLFVAVPLAESLRAAVAEIVDGIRAHEPPQRGVRWVRLDGLHITLRFLGPTPADRIALLAECLAAAASRAARFDITVGGAGAFPPTGRPRTIWLGIRSGAEQLAELNGHLDDALVAGGWDREQRPFRAHLTLARADGVRAGPSTAAALRRVAADLALPSPVDRLVLFESITGEGRARYVVHAEAALAGTAD